jgi:hypothetical protein
MAGMPMQSECHCNITSNVLLLPSQPRAILSTSAGYVPSVLLRNPWWQPSEKEFMVATAEKESMVAAVREGIHGCNRREGIHGGNRREGIHGATVREENTREACYWITCMLASTQQTWAPTPLLLDHLFCPEPRIVNVGWLLGAGVGAKEGRELYMCWLVVPNPVCVEVHGNIAPSAPNCDARATAAGNRSNRYRSNDSPSVSLNTSRIGNIQVSLSQKLLPS